MRRGFLCLPFALIACGSDPPPAPVVVPPQPVVVADVAPVPVPAPVAREPEPVEKAESPLERILRDAIDKSQCDAFDYGAGGGIQTLWCHRPNMMPVDAISKLAGVDYFLSGPHSKSELKLADKSSFGHYNPELVKWLVDKAAPSARDSRIQKMTQPSYDRHLKPLAEIFWLTLQKSKKEPDCFEREKKAYGDLIAKKKLPRDYYERWFYFMNPSFCAKAKTGLGPQNGFDYFMKNGFDADVDGNVTKTVVGFWLRRAMDGTKDQFAEGLTKLITSYDPKMLDRQ